MTVDYSIWINTKNYVRYDPKDAGPPTKSDQHYQKMMFAKKPSKRMEKKHPIADERIQTAVSIGVAVEYTSDLIDYIQGGHLLIDLAKWVSCKNGKGASVVL